MLYPPQVIEFFKVTKTPDGMGGTKQSNVSRGTLRGYLDMLTADDDQQQQKAHIEDGKFVVVVRKEDNKTMFLPNKGDVLQDTHGRWYVVTFTDDPVGIGHHLEVLCDFLPEGVA